MAGLAVIGLLVAAPGCQSSDSLVATSDDVRRSLRTEGCSVFRTYRAKLDEAATREDSARFEDAVSRLMDQIGEGGPYDLTPFPFAPIDSGVAYTRPISTVSTLPGAVSARRRGANYVSVEVSADGSHSLSYFDAKEDGLYSHGRFSSREPDIYDEPRRLMELPLRTGASWQTQKKYGSTTQHKVVGSGQLITPKRKVASLVVTSTSPDKVWFVDDEGNRTAGLFKPKTHRGIAYKSTTEIKTEGAPEGFKTHCAYPAKVPVSFPVSAGWTVLSLYKIQAVSGVSLVRDTAAIGKMEESSGGISTGDTISLGTRDNVLVSLAAFGIDQQPKDYLKDLIVGNLSETEVIQPAMKRVVNGRTAYEKRWRAKGRRGRSLERRVIAFRAADRLFQISVLQPPEMPGGAETAVQVFLDQLTIGV